jgi:predicted nucleic acid-binding protein
VSFLLDTNVVSEWIKPRPDPGVTAWLARVDEDQVFISVVTLTELQYGITRLRPGRRREQLYRWFHDEFRVRFIDRLIPIDDDIAIACGDVLAERQAAGRPVEAMDAFIAATARIIGLTLVTRNEADFAGTVGEIINPWTGLV